VKVAIVPDKFHGTLGARRAAEAMATGVRRALPDARISLHPMADGGEGTIDALAPRGIRVDRLEVPGPLGEAVAAPLLWLDERCAVVEMATASGISLVPPDARDALRATSEGTGALVRAACERGAREVLVGIGGSASTDGGTGAARALGWRFLDEGGAELPPGGGPLVDLALIDGRSSAPFDARIKGLCDVDNPLLGRRGAARAFAPQKGASPAEVARLEQGLAALADRLSADAGIEVGGLAGAGAGGGMGAGLVAFFGAALERGFDVLARLVGLPEAIAGASLVVTGEGTLDEQTLAGKAPMGVARLATGRGARCVVVAGEVRVDEARLAALGMEAVSLVEEVGHEAARSDAAGAIETVVERWVRRRFRG
jgi:glycerate 2-kinase